MNGIERRFKELKSRGEVAFIPYITAGDPTLKMTGDLVMALEEAGADIVEFGVPFSDPVADGVVNQEAAQRALKNNTSLRDIIGLVKDLRQKTEIPIVLFTYYNPVLAYGVPEFAADAAEAGVDGVLCVDLPPEEAGEYKHYLDERGLSTIFLAAPTSTEQRIALIAGAATGFVYYVSRTGVTGERDRIETSVPMMVARIKEHTEAPVAVGFGISTPEQAAEVAGYADGVIVGSAIVRMVGALGDAPDTAARVGSFVKSLVDAAKRRA
ncbi:MAG TPA: tryptophan synthase subunit alpha [Candidatus Hydrogenedentes bacterium]|nr:tryptophan synthase subunit alpha [Candidatus Hydrogenedentota bacterium]HPG66663.1 tryptophan synthase subunit alpha [Candidatus Hydrogenedentota bacterium]